MYFFHQPFCLRSSVMCAVWCFPCHSYRNSSQSTVRSPFSGWTSILAKCSDFKERHSWSQRVCTESSSVCEAPMGVDFESASSAQAASSYGLMVGLSSVSASFNRT